MENENRWNENRDLPILERVTVNTEMDTQT
jgi:hypothetical protein